VRRGTGVKEVRRRRGAVQRGFLDVDVDFLVAQCVDDGFAVVCNLPMLHKSRQPRSRSAGVLLADDGDEFLCCSSESESGEQGVMRNEGVRQSVRGCGCNTTHTPRPSGPRRLRRLVVVVVVMVVVLV
jgi:hypothetical protein